MQKGVKILEAGFLTVGEGSYRYRKGKVEQTSVMGSVGVNSQFLI
jgi:hypothetical protein